MKNIINKNEKTPPSVVILKKRTDIDVVIEKLKTNRPVIVNMSSINSNDARRILEFLSGYCFAKDGSYKKIDELIYRFEV